MLLIPAIDLRGGRCVRLSQGNFAAETQYAVTPQALLRRYRAFGARWVHVVDLDGARDGVRLNTALIGHLVREAGVHLQVGGGVRSASAIEALLDAGVARVIIGSAAVQRPAEVATWLKTFGTERLCLAFDVRLTALGEPQVHIHGWIKNSVVSLWQALDAYPTGAFQHVLCTAIERDGTLSGPHFSLYRKARARFPHLAWQASGGVRNAADLAELADLGVAAAVSGRALLEENLSMKELQPFLPDASSPVSISKTALS
jgi:phosphoribosylformimino-5-aminoimidazole carboxamide ribotide isomerase